MRLKWADPAARGATVGGPTVSFRESPQARLAQAVRCFNASQEARMVAGLTRALGEPWVSIGAVAGSSTEVRITVAWELSWYQWGVDLRDGARSVFLLGKGREVEQLDSSARQWNAAAAAGQISLGAPARGPVSKTGRVGR